jgi:hypothetical protein
LGIALVILPFALMRPLLGTPWVLSFALLFALAAVPVAGALGAARRDGAEIILAGTLPWRNAIAAGLAVVIVVLGVVLARGTSASDLLEGMLLGPLRHPAHFSLVFPWPRGALVVASLSLAMFLLLHGALRLGAMTKLGVDRVVAWMRLAAGLGLGLTLWQFPLVSPDNIVFAYSISCVWFFLWPLHGESAADVAARSWLALLFLGQWLHPFPVPGSQIAWGTFLSIPLATIGAWQAAHWLVAQPSRLFTPKRTIAIDMMLTILLTVVAVLIGNRLAQISARYLDSRPLDLAGAENIRLPDSTTALYRTLVFNAEAHSDVVFSLPGMFSFNLWSGLPAPTLTNVTHWFSLLDEAQQRAIIAELGRHPRACVIVQQPHLDFLRERNLTPGGPLYDYVMGEFQTAFEIEGFEFRVHRGREIAPLLLAELLQKKEPGVSPDSLVRFPLLLAPDQEIAKISFVRMDHPHDAPFVLDGTKIRIEVTPIDMAGKPRGPTELKTLPFSLHGAAEVAVYFDRGSQGLRANRHIVVLQNSKGDELALLRIRP